MTSRSRSVSLRSALLALSAAATAAGFLTTGINAGAATLSAMHSSIGTSLDSIVAGAPAQNKKQTAAAETPAEEPSYTEKQLNDYAKFMAGLPVTGNAALEELTKKSNWAGAAKSLDNSYAQLEKVRLSKIRTWAEATLGEYYTKSVPVYYTFSGPDYLYVSQFYPNASLYIMAGLEPIGKVPNIESMTPAVINQGMSGLNKTLVDSVNISFFVTKNMSSDLRSTQFQGTIPVMMVFLARNGATIETIKHVGLDREGKLREVAPGTRDIVPGVEIAFKSKTGHSQKLVYFSGDISNTAMQKNPAFIRYMAAQAPGVGFYKSASYLLHGSMFSYAKHTVMNKSAIIVQDDTGVPVREYKPDFWDFTVYGNYVGPIPLFSGNFQKEVAGAVKAQGGQKPLDFAMGYRHRINESAVFVAVKKKSAPDQLPGSTSPEPKTSGAAAAAPTPAPAPAPAEAPAPAPAPAPAATPAATLTPVPADKEKVLLITIADDGSTSIDGLTLSKEDLQKLLEKQAKSNPEMPVVLKAAKATPYASISHILEYCTAAGIQKIAFSSADDTATTAGKVD